MKSHIVVFLFGLICSTLGEEITRSTFNKWSTANQEFAINLFKSMKVDGENLVCSPFSVSTVLSMLLEGANGDTATEIKTTLRYSNLNYSAIDESFLRTTRLLRSNKNYTLEVANSIWLKNSFQVRAEFKDTMVKIFNGEERSLNPITGARDINRWVDEKTKHKIPEIINKLSSDTIMVLVNAIFFKGTWKTKFEGRKTTKRYFMNNEVEAKYTDFMRTESVFPYFESTTLKAQILELPYKGDDISMIIVLPNKGNTLNQLENTLTVDHWIEAINSFEKKTVLLNLPKFKIRSTIDLQNPLKSLGMRQTFENGADFGRLSPEKLTKVSKIVQRAVIEVNEKGSEAAVATAVLVVSYSSFGRNSKPLPKIFNASHPFLYFLIHKNTNSILFMGRYTKV